MRTVYAATTAHYSREEAANNANGSIRVISGLISFGLGLRFDFALDRFAYLAFLNDRLAGGFPVTDSAKLTSLVSGICKFFSGTLRAPTACSVEDELDVFRNVFHPRVQFAHRNVDGAFDRAVLFELNVLANIDQEQLGSTVEPLLEFSCRNALRLFFSLRLCRRSLTLSRCSKAEDKERSDNRYDRYHFQRSPHDFTSEIYTLVRADPAIVRIEYRPRE